MASRSLTCRIIARLWVTIIAAKPRSRFSSRDQVEHVALHGNVEAGGRLVGKEKTRLRRKRAGNADAARLPAGQLMREAVGEGGRQSDLREQRLGERRGDPASPCPG